MSEALYLRASVFSHLLANAAVEGTWMGQLDTGLAGWPGLLHTRTHTRF